MNLIRQHKGDESIKATIKRHLDSSPSLRNKRDFILEFIDLIDASSDIERDFREFTKKEYTKELDSIIATHNLKGAETKKFMKITFKNGAFSVLGEGFHDILPPMPLIPIVNTKTIETKEAISNNLAIFFDKYCNLLHFTQISV